MPTADTWNVFGQIVTRRDVALAFVSFLRAWVPTYIAAIENQADLPARTLPLPPDPNLSYRQGLDWDTWEQSWSPCYVVNPQPVGMPDRQYSAEGQYLQEFEVTVCCNVVLTNEMRSLTPTSTDGVLAGTEEDSAVQYADMYGMAAAAAILQHGGIGKWPDGSNVALKTILTKYPEATLPYDDMRHIARSVFAVTSVIDNVVQEADGPAVPSGPDPYVDVNDEFVGVIDVTVDGSTVASSTSYPLDPLGPFDSNIPATITDPDTGAIPVHQP